MLRSLLSTCCFAVLMGPAWANDIAFVVSNGNYQNLPDDRRIDRGHNALVSTYQQAGFEVRDLRNAPRDTFLKNLSEFVSDIDQADRVLVHLNGHIVSIGVHDAFLLSDQSDVTAGDILLDALPINGLMQTLTNHAGQATVLLGSALRATELRDPVVYGPSQCSVPHGVLQISGPAETIARALRDDLLDQDASVKDMADDYEDSLRFCGYISSYDGIVPKGSAQAPMIIDDSGMRNEKAAWMNAQRKNTIEGYTIYLDAFPDGGFAALARQRIDALKTSQSEPNAQDIETNLNLSKAERRQIQSDLTLIGYNTRGVDGIFGNGSRRAIGRWQTARGYESTGFLTLEQIERLDRQADAKRVEIEAEDRAYWQDSGASGGGENGLKAYLKRYPKGIFADRAKADLSDIEEDKRRRADRVAWRSARDVNTAGAYAEYLKKFPKGRFASEAQSRLTEFQEEINAQDDAAWNRAKQVNTAQAYRDYVNSYPNGRHVNQAKQQIAQLSGFSDAQLAKAKAREDRLGTRSPGRLLIETRLTSLGYNVGRVDTKFDRQFRKGLAKFQADRKVPATGYLTRATINQLLQ